jgi:hypothetical protein
MKSVSNLVGQTRTAAKAQIVSDGLVVGTETPQNFSNSSDADKHDKVVSQNPAAGTPAQYESSVDLSYGVFSFSAFGVFGFVPFNVFSFTPFNVFSFTPFNVFSFTPFSVFGFAFAVFSFTPVFSVFGFAFSVFSFTPVFSVFGFAFAVFSFTPTFSVFGFR